MCVCVWGERARVNKFAGVEGMRRIPMRAEVVAVAVTLSDWALLVFTRKLRVCRGFAVIFHACVREIERV